MPAPQDDEIDTDTWENEGGALGVRGQVTIHVRGHQVLRAEPRFR
jgi:hypothetical protein